MGVLNATPDSFYDGGRHSGDDALRHFRVLRRAGAFVVDVGGESTRPGAAPIAAREQIARIESIVRLAVSSPSVWVSVDTADPEVAEAALNWGAHIINDVSCLSN
ncbi:MAG TPA: dihydropteroate synthase, partial [Polyangiaceae bacterium]